jgi:hypothetical protein
MPRIAPPGVQIDHYLPVPEASRGAPVDPAKGYRSENLGRGLYFLTNNMYQSMFLVYIAGVVVIDAPPSFAEHIPAFNKVVGGHVARIGDRRDVSVQAQYMHDLAAAAKQSLSDTEFGYIADPKDRTNLWALADSYMDRATTGCVNAMTDKWAARLAGFDAYIWDHCIAMEESLRAD